MINRPPPWSVHVIKTIVNYLADESLLVGDANLVDASAVKEFIRSARAMPQDLQAGSTRECMAILKILWQRLLVGRDPLQITLAGSAARPVHPTSHSPFQRSFIKNGKGIRVIVRADKKDMGGVDRTLVQLLERSRIWFDRCIKAGDSALKTITDGRRQ